jgi:hypothetical protein
LPALEESVFEQYLRNLSRFSGTCWGLG